MVALGLLIARYHYLKTYGVPHRFGRTKWIYWPTQISIALTVTLMVTQAVLLFITDSSEDTPLVAAFGCFGMGLAWVSHRLFPVALSKMSPESQSLNSLQFNIVARSPQGQPP
jgi:hypothetical protein